MSATQLDDNQTLCSQLQYSDNFRTMIPNPEPMTPLSSKFMKNTKLDIQGSYKLLKFENEFQTQQIMSIYYGSKHCSLQRKRTMHSMIETWFSASSELISSLNENKFLFSNLPSLINCIYEFLRLRHIFLKKQEKVPNCINHMRCVLTEISQFVHEKKENYLLGQFISILSDYLIMHIRNFQQLAEQLSSTQGTQNQTIAQSQMLDESFELKFSVCYQLAHKSKRETSDLVVCIENCVEQENKKYYYHGNKTGRDNSLD